MCRRVPTSPSSHVPESPSPHVPTSPRPRVPTSPRPHVPESPRPHVPESPRPHVPTSPRPHVPTSHVPTSPSPHVPESPRPKSHVPVPLLVTAVCIYARQGFKTEVLHDISCGHTTHFLTCWQFYLGKLKFRSVTDFSPGKLPRENFFPSKLEYVKRTIEFPLTVTLHVLKG